MKSFTKTLARFGTRGAVKLDAAAGALIADAQAAAKLRTHSTDPNVQALGVERVRAVLDRWGWLFIACGLGFTTVNVQAFVAGTNPGTVRNAAAWLVEPMVMGLLLVLLRGEQVANRHGVTSGSWVVWTRRATLAITYVMNTWSAWESGVASEIFIHSVPPILVFCAAEALTQQREALTQVVDSMEVRPVFAEPKSKTADLHSEQPVADEAAKRPRRAAHNVRQIGRRRGEGLAAMRDAYQALVEEAIDENRDWKTIRPVDVDVRAGVAKGSAKKRMKEMRETFEQEVNTDGVAS